MAKASTQPPASRPPRRRALRGASDPAALQAAWVPGEPSQDAWTPRPWVPVEKRVDAGYAARQNAPRSSHGQLDLPPNRDPIAILAAQEVERLQQLVPLRHQRMAESPFAYYRGTPAVMAGDLANTPRSGIIVQASGDAHISNFGLFASPERALVFDANDFDETLPAPWEWDVKRLAASVQIAARGNAMASKDARACVLATVRGYREAQTRFAGMRLRDIWYDQTTSGQIASEIASLTEEAHSLTSKAAQKVLDSLFTKTRGKDELRAVDRLTAVIDGEWRIVDDYPVVQHLEVPGGPAALAKTFADYRASLANNRRDQVERYRFVDFALKVVGVGSVGTQCFVVLLEGRDQDDPLILQAKEAVASVLQPYLEQSPFTNNGERVVVGQRLMQTTPDIFLGWTKSPAGRDYYFRQLWDQKGSFEIEALGRPGLAWYGGLCARTLARAHARSGDPVAISAYLGTSDRFDGAVADFAEAYADLNERDYQAYLAAIKDGRVSVDVPQAPATQA